MKYNELIYSLPSIAEPTDPLFWEISFYRLKQMNVELKDLTLLQLNSLFKMFKLDELEMASAMKNGEAIVATLAGMDATVSKELIERIS